MRRKTEDLESKVAAVESDLQTERKELQTERLRRLKLCIGNLLLDLAKLIFPGTSTESGPRVVNSTTSVQCKPPYVWTDMVQGYRMHWRMVQGRFSLYTLWPRYSRTRLAQKVTYSLGVLWEKSSFESCKIFIKIAGVIFSVLGRLLGTLLEGYHDIGNMNYINGLPECIGTW